MEDVMLSGQSDKDEHWEQRRSLRPSHLDVRSAFLWCKTKGVRPRCTYVDWLRLRQVERKRRQFGRVMQPRFQGKLGRTRSANTSTKRSIGQGIGRVARLKFYLDIKSYLALCQLQKKNILMLIARTWSTLSKLLTVTTVSIDRLEET